MSIETQSAPQVLRSVWASQGEDLPQLEEDCAPNKVCKNMKDVTFDGFAEGGLDLQTAWKQRLEREGKLNTSGGSIRDLVLGLTENN